MVTILDKTGGMSRRQLLKTGAASAVLMITGTAVICPDQAWGLEARALKPDTLATLIKMARDVYPRRQEGVSIWVVPSTAITASEPDSKDSFFDPAADKVYRHPTFYEIPDKVGHM